MADDGLKHFGIGALIGGAVAYWARGLQERAERTGRAVGARTYGAEVEPETNLVPPGTAFAGRSERVGRATGSRMYGTDL
jgi:hypothetical protein